MFERIFSPKVIDQNCGVTQVLYLIFIALENSGEEHSKKRRFLCQCTMRLPKIRASYMILTISITHIGLFVYNYFINKGHEAMFENFCCNYNITANLYKSFMFMYKISIFKITIYIEIKIITVADSTKYD